MLLQRFSKSKYMEAFIHEKENTSLKFNVILFPWLFYAVN